MLIRFFQDLLLFGVELNFVCGTEINYLMIFHICTSSAYLFHSVVGVSALIGVKCINRAGYNNKVKHGFLFIIM